MSKQISIAGRIVGDNAPSYLIAELSANHNGDYQKAVDMVHAAKESGADAIKLQTYTADTLTIPCDKPHFKIEGGTLWDGRTLYDLYEEAYTPWDWQPKLKEIADEIGIHLFSSPFDKTAVDFLEEMNVPVYKVASFECVDIPLIEYIASKGKPIIMSTGLSTYDEIDDAVSAAREAGCSELVLLKCTSAYPAPPEEMNLKAMAAIRDKFDVSVGLSDHTLDNAVSVAAVSMGASVIERHFTLSRKEPSADSDFSLEPAEFKSMVDQIRYIEKALGQSDYEIGEREVKSRKFRRSLFVVQDVKEGDIFTEENIRSIRPGNGIAPKHYKEILGKKASSDIERGTPLSFDMVAT